MPVCVNARKKEKQTAAAVTAEKSKSWKKLKRKFLIHTRLLEIWRINFINFKYKDFLLRTRISTTTTDVFACMDMHYFRTLLSYFNTSNTLSLFLLLNLISLNI
ncbi:hypothetical protein GQX74_012251 [Glossina fuscipes]|nr:hypothetical protein GQX74_012251 [Glossina fuscipes]